MARRVGERLILQLNALEPLEFRDHGIRKVVRPNKNVQLSASRFVRLASQSEHHQERNTAGCGAQRPA